MLPTGGRASDVSFVASNSMFHDPELSVWNVMGSSPNKVSPCTSLSSLSNLTSTTGMLTVCLLVMMMHEKSSNAFMGARPLMDRAHEYDRLDEAFLADLRLILIATYLKKHSQNLHEDIFIRRKSHNHVLKNRTFAG